MTECIRFSGDVWISADYETLFPEESCEGLVMNLEGPITSFRHDAENKICLASDEKSSFAAFPMVPFAACLANNHIMDHGIQGFNDTLAALKKRGIHFFGAEDQSERCNNPLLIEVEHERVGLMGCVCSSTHPIFAQADLPGVAPIDLQLINDDMKIARAQGASRLIVTLH